MNTHQYLTVVYSEPSRFTVWCKLMRQDSAAITEQLEQLFCEPGAPEEIMT